MHIVSGKYEHQENGIANGITETWHLKGNDLDITFETPTQTLQAQVQFDAQNKIHYFRYHIDDTLNGVYDVQGKQLLVKRQLPANTYLEDTLVWSSDAHLDLPFLSCKGHTILLLNQKEIVPTFAPILRSGDRAGDMAKQSVQQLQHQIITVSDKRYETRHYRYLRDYWLDEHGVVIRAEADTYKMVLVEYTL